MKKLVSILLIIVSALSMSVSAARLDVADFPDIYICGKEIEYTSCHPQYKDGELYIPVRETFETFGSKVVWHNKEKKITVKVRNVNIDFNAKSGDIVIDNKIDKGGIKIKDAVFMDVNYCYVKLDMLGEIFNIKRQFMQDDNKINIEDGMPLTVEIDGDKYSRTNKSTNNKKETGKLLGYTKNGLEIRKDTFKLFWIIPLWSKIYVQDLNERTYYLYSED